MKRDPAWDRWDEVDPLLESALELPSLERAAFLDRECGDDAELRRVVEELIEAASEPDSRASGPGADLVHEALGSDSGSRSQAHRRVGTVVGPYTLVEVLGVGGMGAVYKAERSDGAFDREVAIKLLRLSLETPGVVERFELERQILASLTHPGIAQLLDGGVTPDDRPYLVMEYVDGVPVDRYADGRRLSIEDRLWLVLSIAEAVDHAHRHMVVHRDLKPGNILVTAEGGVKLLDFGVAKLLEPVDRRGAAETHAASRFITPEYAAPEQIRADPVSAATDVHALGVLLYELLTGSRPFCPDPSASEFEIQRAILNTVPRTVSASVSRRDTAAGNSNDSPEAVAERRRTTPRALARALSGDLDAIVSKALRKRPEDRYPSVEEFRDDVIRYLTDRPVRAREGLWSYRARKFVRRNWVAVSAAAGLVILLSGFTGLLVRQQALTARERDRAEREAENAQLVVDFLSDVFRGRNPAEAPPDTITARELVAWGEERVENEFTSRSDVQADLLLVLGRAWANLGSQERAAAAMERAIGVRERAFGADSEEVADALLRLAGMYRATADPLISLAPARRAMEILRETGSTDDGLLATAAHAVASALVSNQLPDSALPYAHEAIRIRESLRGDSLALMEGRLLLAFALRNLDRNEEARAIYESVIPRFRAHPDSDPTEVATHLNNLAFLLTREGEDAGAVPLYREAWEIQSSILGSGHPATVRTSYNLAGALQRLGRFDEVFEVLQAVLSALEETVAPEDPRILFARRAVGDFLLRTGRIEESEPILREVAEGLGEMYGPQADITSFAYARIAAIRIMAGDTVPGRAFLDRLHAWMAQQKRENGGRLAAGGYNMVDQWVHILGDTPLESERRRFAELLGEEPVR